MLPALAMSAEYPSTNILQPITNNYSAKSLWQESDIIQAIEDDLIASDNYFAITACFTAKSNPLSSWDLSVKKNILQRLCALLKIDEKEQANYTEQLLRAKPNELSVAYYSTSYSKPTIDHKDTTMCSSDIIFTLYTKLHLNRWDPTKDHRPVPALIRSPRYCELITK